VAGSSQCYVVLGYDDQGTMPGGASNTLCVRDDPAGLAGPLLDKPQPRSVGSVTLHFTDRATNEDGFSISRVSGNGSVSSVDDIRTTSTSIFDPNMGQGAPQCYRVIEYDDNGFQDAFSDTQCVA
jgi:hypothetical protein